jgi:four helix bundle protein
MLFMDNQDWTIRSKPYELRARLFGFACVMIRLAQFLHTRGRIAVLLSEQVLKSGTSAGANYEEADDGSSRRDRNVKRKIVLRELKETSFRLRIMRQTGILTAAHDPVIAECSELVKIVATVIRKSKLEKPTEQHPTIQPSNDPRETVRTKE